MEEEIHTPENLRDIRDGGTENDIHFLTALIIENEQEGRFDSVESDFLDSMEGLSDLRKEGELLEETQKNISSIYEKHIEAHPDYDVENPFENQD